ncbi:MAG: hypothetical protein M3Z85_21845 [Acidobacteriota bacterium]|nr:hypothetical protein [Acidobacteriota bacterium]
MRLIAFLCLVALLPRASAITLGQSNENVKFTGLGGNASGAGQSSVTWGSCAFDGTNTKCIVSGPFTGLGGGGTFSFALTYPGNGPTPLTAISSVPGGDLIFFNLTSGSLVMTITEGNGTTVTFYDPSHFNFTFAGSTCTGVPLCAVGQVGLTPNATLTGPISGAFDTTPIVRTSLGVISASDYGGFSSIAPGSWIEIFGSNLGTIPFRVWGAADFKGIQAPTALAGTTVTMGGQPAFVYFVSPGQVDVQAPSGIPAGPQPVVVTTAGGVSAPTTVTVNSVEPGLLSPPAFRLSGGQYVTALFSDGVTFVLPPSAIARVPSRRARPGDALTLYGVGFGPVAPDYAVGQIVQQTDALSSTFRASFAGTPATVLYSGFAPGYIGLYQFNVVVPNVAASDSVPLTFSLGGNNLPQILVIPVQN